MELLQCLVLWPSVFEGNVRQEYVRVLNSVAVLVASEEAYPVYFKSIPLLPSAHPAFPNCGKNLTLYRFPGKLLALLSKANFFPPSVLTYIVLDPPTAHTSEGDRHATSVIPYPPVLISASWKSKVSFVRSGSLGLLKSGQLMSAHSGRHF